MIVPAVTGLGKAAEESVNPDTSDVLLRLLPRLLDPVKVEADAIWEEVKPMLEERDFLRSEGDRLHSLFENGSVVALQTDLWDREHPARSDQIAQLPELD